MTGAAPPDSQSDSSSADSSSVDLRQADLLLIAHGGTGRPLSPDALESHADSLRQQKAFHRVATAYLRGGETPMAVLEELAAPRVFILPHFMSAGYFATHKIPSLLGLGPLPRLGPEIAAPRIALARERRHGERQILCYCPPCGSHPHVARIARRLALAALAAAGCEAKDCALLVAGHGTARDPASAHATRAEAERLAKAGDFARVAAAFLDQDPRPGAVLAELAGKVSDVVLLPFLAGRGRHGERDLPALRATAADLGLTLHLADPVGEDPEMAALMLDLVRQAAAELPRQDFPSSGKAF